MSATFEYENQVDMPVNGEYYSYYPTWGQQQTGLTGLTGVTGVTGREQWLSNGVDEVVISGVSGKFGTVAENVEELAERLYNKRVQQLTEEEKKMIVKTAVYGIGKQWEDAQVYGINQTIFERMPIEYVEKMKPIVEVAYETIFDAGLNVQELKGSRTGVFIGTTVQHQPIELAEKLAQLYELRGPVQTFNITAQSGLVALDAAFQAIKKGLCENAIVIGLTGAELEGRHGIAGVFVQKKNVSRRFYAKYLNSRVGHGMSQITYPLVGQSTEMPYELLKQVYAESAINPALVSYVESHVAVPQQQQTLISNTIGQIVESLAGQSVKRTVPLFVGQTVIPTTYGQNFYGQNNTTTTDLISLVKMLISIQRGVIPANFEYVEPCKEVSSMLDGRYTLVNTNTPFRGGLMALNSVSPYSNVHIVLQPNNEFVLRKLGKSSFWNEIEQVNEIAYQPRLFQFCSRSQQGLEEIIREIRRKPTDLATQFLLHVNSSQSPITHPFRGFTVLNGLNEIVEIEQLPTTTVYGGKQQKVPVWYVFGGMGQQWTGMGQEYMKLAPFRESIMRSAEYLKPFGIELVELINGKEQNVYNKAINAIVATTAIQLALVDTLRRAGVEAEGFIGQSIGELACAYADMTLTAEQAIRAAYQFGKYIEQTQMPFGGLQLGQNTMGDLSYYLKPVQPMIKLALENIIQTPKIRSGKWISASWPEHKWQQQGQYVSAEYLLNALCNTISPVMFEETIRQYVPRNAVVVEVGPHGLFQEVIKRQLNLNSTLPTTTVYGIQKPTVVSLMIKETPRQLEHFWTQLGRIYNRGVNVDSVKLYVPYGFEHTLYPVPVTAGFISHYARLAHQPTIYKTVVPTIYKYTIDTTAMPFNGEENYLYQQQIQGRKVYPATGYLYLIWKSLAKMQGVEQVEQMPVAFENVEFHRETPLNEIKKAVEFVVSIVPQTGAFELTESGYPVVTGRVFVPVEKTFENSIVEPLTEKFSNLNTISYEQEKMLEQEQILRELSTRGFEFQGEFQPIPFRSNIEGTRGELAWTGKWVPFLSAMLQMNVLGQKQINGVQQWAPKFIRSIRINPRVHFPVEITSLESRPWKVQYEQQQMPLELIQQWKSKFLSLQYQQQQIIEKLVRLQQQQPTLISEKQYRILGELQQLIEIQKQVELFDENKWFKQTTAAMTCEGREQLFSQLKQQLINHAQQQKLISQLVRSQGVFSVQEEIVEDIKEIIYQQEQFQIECELVSQERQFYMNQLKYQLSQQMQLIEKLYTQSTTQFTIEQQRETLITLERLISEQKQIVLQRLYKQEQIIKSVLYFIKSTQQHIYLVEQIIRQQQPSLIVKQICEELELVLREQEKFFIQMELTSQNLKQYLTEIQSRLHDIHYPIQQFTLRQIVDYEQVRVVLGQLEKLVEKRFEKISQCELNKIAAQREIQFIQHKLQTIYQQIERVILNKLTITEQPIQEQQQRMLVQELQTIQQLKQQLFWTFKTVKQEKKIQQQNKILFPVSYSPLTGSLVSGGVEMSGLRNTLVEQATLSHEILEHYLNECRRYISYIIRKCEQPTQLSLVNGSLLMPTNIMLNQQLEKQLVQEGKLLQLLQHCANIECSDVEQYLTKVQRVLNDKLAFWRAIDEDRVLNYLNKKSVYLRPLVQHIVELNQLPSQWFTELEYENGWLSLAQKIKQTLGETVVFKPRDLFNGVERMIGEILMARTQRNQRIQETLKNGRLLVNLLENIKSLQSNIVAESVFGNKQWTGVQQQQSLLETIARVLGWNEEEIVRRNEKTTLLELGLTTELCIPIKRVLEELYNMTLTVREIQMLTIEQLKAFETGKNVKQWQTGRRVSNYLMPLRTIERLNNVETGYQTPLFIIHPVEGHLNMIRSWAQQMKYPVYGVHFSQEMLQQQFESIEQLAQYYWQQIEKELTRQGFNSQRVHLSGLSFGSLVAMEMAAQRAHLVSSLSLIEATTPSFFTRQNKWTSVEQSELESEALLAFLQQYTTTTQLFNIQQLQQELVRMQNIEQRVRHVVREIVQRSPFQFEPVDLEQAARAFVIKSVLAQRYQPRKYVTGIPEIMLVKSVQQQQQYQRELEQILGQIYNGKVYTQLLDGDYKSYFVGKTGAQLAQIINEYIYKSQF